MELHEFTDEEIRLENARRHDIARSLAGAVEALRDNAVSSDSIDKKMTLYQARAACIYFMRAFGMLPTEFSEKMMQAAARKGEEKGFRIYGPLGEE